MINIYGLLASWEVARVLNVLCWPLSGLLQAKAKDVHPGREIKIGILLKTFQEYRKEKRIVSEYLKTYSGKPTPALDVCWLAVLGYRLIVNEFVLLDLAVIIGLQVVDLIVKLARHRISELLRILLYLIFQKYGRVRHRHFLRFLILQHIFHRHLPQLAIKDLI